MDAAASFGISYSTERKTFVTVSLSSSSFWCHMLLTQPTSQPSSLQPPSNVAQAHTE